MAIKSLSGQSYQRWEGDEYRYIVGNKMIDTDVINEDVVYANKISPVGDKIKIILLPSGEYVTSGKVKVKTVVAKNDLLLTLPFKTQYNSSHYLTVFEDDTFAKADEGIGVFIKSDDATNTTKVYSCSVLAVNKGVDMSGLRFFRYQ